MNDLRAAFGARVRELRRRLGLPQDELAHRAGMHTTYLSDIERGTRNPSLINIGRLSEALHVSLAELFAAFPERLSRRALQRLRAAHRQTTAARRHQ